MSRIWEMKGGTYTKTLAKIQVRGIFSYTRYPKKCSTQTYRDLYKDAMLVLTRTWMSSNMAEGNQQKHLFRSVNEFCDKSVNLFFEKLINIK